MDFDLKKEKKYFLLQEYFGSNLFVLIGIISSLWGSILIALLKCGVRGGQNTFLDVCDYNIYMNVSQHS